MAFVPTYRANWTVTNGTPYTASEAVSWNGATGSGAFVSESDSSIYFTHTAGVEPQIGDDILGASGASRRVSSWALTVGNTYLNPVTTPFSVGSTDAQGLEFSVDIARTSAVSTFRTIFVFVRNLLNVSGVNTHLPNSFSPSRTDDFFGLSSGLQSGLGMSCGAQFSPTGIAGVSIAAKNSIFPRWGRHFENVDSLGVSWPHLSVRSSLADISTIKFRFTVVGTITNPTGLLSKDYPSGSTTSMTGEFTIWKVSVALDGDFVHVGDFYIDSDYQRAINPVTMLSLVPEWYTFYPSTPTLDSDPLDFRYYDVRIFAASENRWHWMTDWQIPLISVTPDPDHGWSAQAETGKLTAICGVHSAYKDNELNKYLFSELTYYDSTTEMPAVGVTTESAGGADTVTGPTWRTGGAGTLPFAMQEHARGYIVLHPGTTTASAVFTAREGGTYRFDGDFARAWTVSGAGDGVTVSIVSEGETLLASTLVTNVATVDLDDVFDAGNASVVNFSVSKLLALGETVEFRVGRRTTTTADPTAFRVAISSLLSGKSLTPATKGDLLYAPRGFIFQGQYERVGGNPRKLVGTGGLKHEVYYFSDADSGEIWRSCPDGIVAIALGQSESDASADVQALLNANDQVEFISTAGNRKLWLHVWRRSSLRPGTTGTDVPPEDTGLGSLPRGTGVFTNDLTLAGDNLNNGRIVNFHGYTHRVYGFRDIKNGDWFVGKSGIVATAFQHAYPAKSFVKTKISARTNQSTTIQFETTNVAYIDGWLHVWSKT